MADDQVPEDLLREVEAAFAADDSVLEVALEAFVAKPPPSAERLREDTAQASQPDLFGQEAQDALDEWEAESRELRVRKILRTVHGSLIVVTACCLYFVAAMSSLDGTTHPLLGASAVACAIAIVFGLGLYAEAAVGWVTRGYRNLADSFRERQDARASRDLRKTHRRDCGCKHCRLKRRWAYWRKLRRYPYRRR